MRLLFLDVEASGLYLGSFPVEVGWCDVDGAGEAHLIRPAHDWQGWDENAQAVHAITLEQLAREGEPVHQVAARMAEVLAAPETLVVASAPDWDGRWAEMVFSAAGRPERIQVRGTAEAHRLATAAILKSAIEDAAALLAAVPSRQYSLPGFRSSTDVAVAVLREEIRGMLQAVVFDGQPAHRALADAQAEARLYREIQARVRAVCERWRARLEVSDAAT